MPEQPGARTPAQAPLFTTHPTSETPKQLGAGQEDAWAQQLKPQRCSQHGAQWQEWKMTSHRGRTCTVRLGVFISPVAVVPAVWHRSSTLRTHLQENSALLPSLISNQAECPRRSSIPGSGKGVVSDMTLEPATHYQWVFYNWEQEQKGWLDPGWKFPALPHSLWDLLPAVSSTCLPQTSPLF